MVWEERVGGRERRENGEADKSSRLAMGSKK